MELTDREIDRIYRVNRQNGYGISAKQLKELSRQHRKARAEGNTHKMELIEYRLTAINFHHECGLLAHGRYAELAEELKAW
ncbi:MAG: hypothetical protein IJT94_15675 [Oscillibacter sp.]|nr:hypothetical protein [Oscillibacter sp.]